MKFCEPLIWIERFWDIVCTLGQLTCRSVVNQNYYDVLNDCGQNVEALWGGSQDWISFLLSYR